MRESIPPHQLLCKVNVCVITSCKMMGVNILPHTDSRLLDIIFNGKSRPLTLNPLDKQDSQEKGII